MTGWIPDKRFFQPPWQDLILFTSIFLLIGGWMGYHSILFFQPQGIHFIRQTDSLAFVHHYLLNGMKFLQPGILSLESEGGKVASEFPVIYYLTALLYQVFGEHPFFLRFINMFLVACGLYGLHRVIRLILEDRMIAMILTFLFFSSTVLIYYSCNFLPDPAAFGLIMTAWWPGMLFIGSGRMRHLLISVTLFTLAGLIKVTTAFHPVAFLGAILFTRLHKGNIRTLWKEKRFWSTCLPVLTGLALIAAWNGFVIHYNSNHQDYYFLRQARPFWSITPGERLVVWDHISRYWYSKYYYQSTFHAFVIILLFSLVFFRHTSRLLNILSGLILAGGTAFFLLFYAQFRDHDYYFLVLIPVIMFIVIRGFEAIRNRFPKIFRNVLFKAALLVLTVLSLNYAKLNMVRRYTVTDDPYDRIGQQLAGIGDYADSLGITRSAVFIVLGDPTPNGSLYFLKRLGWALPDTSAASLNRLHSLSPMADYILITDTAFARIETVSSVTGPVKGTYRNTVISSIRR